jgi:hypothetical protein
VRFVLAPHALLHTFFDVARRRCTQVQSCATRDFVPSLGRSSALPTCVRTPRNLRLRHCRAEIFNEALAGGVKNLNFGGLSTRLGKTMYKYKFRIPPYYTLLVRSLTILEGIALASDPNYKVLGAAYPWVARRLLTDESPELRQTLRKLLYRRDGGFRFDRLEALLQQAVLSPAAPQRDAAAATRGARPLP